MNSNLRHFLVDLSRFDRTVVASAGSVVEERKEKNVWSARVEGIADTPGVLLLRLPAPKSVTLDGATVTDTKYDPAEKLLWVRYANSAQPRRLEIKY